MAAVAGQGKEIEVPLASDASLALEVKNGKLVTSVEFGPLEVENRGRHGAAPPHSRPDVCREPRHLAVTRPDGGVLGCFLIGDSPAQDRFAPVSLEAAEDAVLNQMVFGASQKVESITHPFIAGQVAEFDLGANTPRDTVVLADARGSLYATCGVLPRKTIVVPKDFIEPSLKKLEPTFQVGPVLGFERQGTLVPVVPAPRIEGMDAGFVHDDEADYAETALPPTPPVSELPAQRVRLTEGWVRMSRQKTWTLVPGRHLATRKASRSSV